MSILLPDGTRALQLSKAQYEEIGVQLDELLKVSKSTSILLCDYSGLLISHYGTLAQNKLSTMATLVSNNYAATNGIANIVDEEEGFKVNFYEGKQNSVYITAITDEFILASVFSKATTFGLVRAKALKSIPTLREIITRVDEVQPVQETGKTDNVKNAMDSQDFQDELSSKLDELLGGSK